MDSRSYEEAIHLARITKEISNSPVRVYQMNFHGGRLSTATRLIAAKADHAYIVVNGVLGPILSRRRDNTRPFIHAMLVSQAKGTGLPSITSAVLD